MARMPLHDEDAKDAMSIGMHEGWDGVIKIPLGQYMAVLAP